VSNEHPAPDAIMQLKRAYAGSKALVSAVELELFTTLADGPLAGEALRAKLGLQSRGATDWLDALVSVGMLDRDGDLYANTAATACTWTAPSPPMSAGWWWPWPPTPATGTRSPPRCAPGTARF
jgi:hypothetical protein